MKTTPNLITFTVTPSSLINGANNSYTITAEAALPIDSTDSISFDFPS